MVCCLWWSLFLISAISTTYHFCILLHVPSGKQTVCELENGPVEIVDLAIKNGDLPIKNGDLPINSMVIFHIYRSLGESHCCRCCRGPMSQDFSCWPRSGQQIKGSRLGPFRRCKTWPGRISSKPKDGQPGKMWGKWSVYRQKFPDEKKDHLAAR